MRKWYQIYRNEFWYTSTTDEAEANAIADQLRKQGYTVEIRIR